MAYVARLLIHRYAMLGILDDDGYPVREAGLMAAEYHNVVAFKRSESWRKANTGRLCESCHTYAVIKKDGCDFCLRCGERGACS